MKKLTLGLLTLAVSLWAADFWVAKPYTEWSEKDATKLVKSSPWAKEVTVSLGGPGGMDSGLGSGKGGRNRGAGSTGNMGETGGLGGAVTPNSAGSAGGGNGMGGGDIGGRGSASDMGGSGMGSGGGGMGFPAMFLWESSTTVKQAKMKLKYGSEAGTSDASKQFLAREEPNYILSVRVPPQLVARGGTDMKEALKAATVLNVKGKDAMKPLQVELLTGNGAGVLVFAFSKEKPLVAEDGEVEFVSKVGISSIKCKFDLKKMVVNGKLDM